MFERWTNFWRRLWRLNARRMFCRNRRGGDDDANHQRLWLCVSVTTGWMAGGGHTRLAPWDGRLIKYFYEAFGFKATQSHTMGNWIRLQYRDHLSDSEVSRVQPEICG